MRAYDSRLAAFGSESLSPRVPIRPGETRTIGLATGVDSRGHARVAVPAGAVGAIVRITVDATVGAGYLTMYSAALGQPPVTSSVNWYETGAIVGADAVVSVDAQGRIKVTGYVNTTEFVIDVFGYLF